MYHRRQITCTNVAHWQSNLSSRHLRLPTGSSFNHQCQTATCRWCSEVMPFSDIIIIMTIRTLPYLSSSRIRLGALGHTLTPFCSVCRQFFGFIPGDVHVLQISSDDVHPIFPWASRLSLVAPQYPLCSLTRNSATSSILSTWPSHLSLLSLMMSSNFTIAIWN